MIKQECAYICRCTSLTSEGSEPTDSIEGESIVADVVQPVFTGTVRPYEERYLALR
jgi:hypothetical protein